MPSRSDRLKRWTVRLLIPAWLIYSGGVLAWWAYTEPGANICFGTDRSPNQRAP